MRIMIPVLSLSLGLVLLAGCSPSIIKSEVYTLLDNKCQTAEVTTSWQGKTLPTGCTDAKGAFHLTATPGRPTMQTVETIVTGAITGGALYGAAKSLKIDTGTDINIPIGE